jgi:DNA-directed RNA polymerase subunit beta
MDSPQPTTTALTPSTSTQAAPKPTGMKFIGDVLHKDKGMLHNFDDFDTKRKLVFDYAAEAVKQRFPVSNERYTLSVDDIGYDNTKPVSLKEQKHALLNNMTITKKLQGRWTLTDNATGKVIDKSSKRTLMNIPYMTNRGTFIRNGTEYALNNQFRLIPGVFSKWTDDGRLESHVNVKQGTGNTFKVSMDPSSAEFTILAKGRKIKLYPVLRALDVPDSLIEEVWGKEILDRNRKGSMTQAVRSAMQSLTPTYRKMNKTAAEEKTELDPAELADFKGALMKSELDPDATQTTLNARHSFVSPALFMDVTKKLIGMSRKEQTGDDRDSLEFQRVYSAPHFIAEKILKDPGNIIKSSLWKVTNKGNLSALGSGTFNKHMDSLFNTSGLGMAVEEINPFDTLDQSYRITRMGEGGIRDENSIPEEARAVQPTYRGYVDPIRSPESIKIGVDLRLTHDVQVGEDGILYRNMFNPKTGKMEMVDSVTAARKVIGFPESMKTKGNFAPAMVRGEGLKYVNKKDIDYTIQHGSDLFSLGANLVPLTSGIKGMRLLMGSKMISSALPLVSREAPLVGTADSKGRDFYERLSQFMGAQKSTQDGVVKSVSKDEIVVQNADGTQSEYEMYNNFPFARKTSIKNDPLVKVGQPVKKGALLATSNFTSPDGKAALGTNLRIAYAPYKGHTFEDGIVISESAAKKLTSEHTYATKLRDEEGQEVSKTNYVSMFPGKYTAEQYNTITPEGVVKPGTVVKPGDPLVLATRTQGASVRTLGRRTTKDVSEVWDYPEQGVVTDVTKNKDGWHVYVRANSPAKPADKLSGRYGNKGVISAILPDNLMPHGQDGKPFDVMLNPVGVLARTNSAQLIEAALGKIAQKTGKPYVLPGFTDDPDASLVDYAVNELKKNNMSDTEDIFDPETGRKIPKVFTGTSYFYKLQHTAEAKSGSRAFGGYTLENQPSVGGSEGAKRIGNMEVAALVSHGAKEILKDMKMIRGQKNDDYWRDLKLGKTPIMPTNNFVFNKFLSSLQAAGINVDKQKNNINIFAMTNDQAKDLTGAREVTTGDTYDPKHFKPIPGGLFDENLTGGSEGNKFSYIKLDEPILNPVMEDSARRILGLKEAELQDLISGKVEYKGKYGGAALKQKLADIPLHQEIIKTVHDIKSTDGTKRDNMIKKLRALKSIDEHKMKPEDFMMDRVPVIPPMYRPISASEDMTLASDFNYLYREMLFNRDDLREAKDKLPDEMLADIRGNMYKNFKALAGLGDPVNTELKEKGVGGILEHVFGKNSAKSGMFQRRMIGGSVDLSARTAITPNPNLKLNQVGLPESVAWELYEPFIIRQLVRHGTSAMEAAKAVADKRGDAEKALLDVMKERPVLINRAPTMHKWGLMGAWPTLVKGHTLQIPTSVCAPFGADFDGDTMSIHVPVSEKAAKEAREKMMPEHSLIGARNFELMYAPAHEYVQGAYLATKAPKKGLPLTFETEKEAEAAYKAGKIDVDTPIKIRHRAIQ